MHPSASETLARRIREIRLEIYGVEGSQVLAEEIGIPRRAWTNYEAGVTLPGDVLLRFLVVTGVSPSWLLRGDTPRYTVDPSVVRQEWSHRPFRF